MQFCTFDKIELLLLRSKFLLEDYYSQLTRALDTLRFLSVQLCVVTRSIDGIQEYEYTIRVTTCLFMRLVYYIIHECNCIYIFRLNIASISTLLRYLSKLRNFMFLILNYFTFTRQKIYFNSFCMISSFLSAGKWQYS